MSKNIFYIIALILCLGSFNLSGMNTSNKRTKKACLNCSEKHKKCEGGHHCNFCLNNSIECLENTNCKPKGRPKKYISDKKYKVDNQAGLRQENKGSCKACTKHNLSCNDDPIECQNCINNHRDCYYPAIKIDRKVIDTNTVQLDNILVYTNENFNPNNNIHDFFDSYF